MVDKRQYKGISLFSIFKNIIESELKEFEDYIIEISSALKEKQDKLEEDYNKATINTVENEEIDIHSFFEEDLNKYFKVFPIYTFNPLLLTIFGQFENWLKKLCDLDSRKGFSEIKVSDIAGNNYIEKSRSYLKIVSEISLESTNSEWKKITEIQKIRNCIVHNDSNIIVNKNIAIDKQELYMIVSKDNRIKFDGSNGNFYIQDKQFLLEVIVLIKNYLLDVIEKLKVRKVVAKNIAMPHDNTNWGKEKSEILLKMLIFSLDLIDENENRDDEFKDSDLKFNLQGNLKSMGHNLTKLFAFFSNGQWETTDSDIIFKERNEGLERLKKIYNS